MASTIITGAAFGASLVASGVYQPSVILSQLKLDNWHMIQAFLSATASSAILVTIASKLGYISPKPRSYSPLGWFARYDGNLIGGILLGHGLALSGACPGTVFAQVAMGIKSGYYALAGCAVGGIIYTGLVRPYVASCPKPPAPKDEKLSMDSALGTSRTVAFIGLELALAAVIGSTVALTSVGPEAKISPILGGILIGGATQGVSILTRKSLIGISTAFEEVGEWFWAALNCHSTPKATSILFATATVVGAKLTALAFPTLGEVISAPVSPLNAAIGGALMIVGSRMAGGCTSGHGVSGMSLLSISSLVTIGSAVGWGVIASKFLL